MAVPARTHLKAGGLVPVAQVFARGQAPRELRERVAGIAAVLAARKGAAAVIACQRASNFLAALLALWHLRREALVPASLQPEAVASLSTKNIPILRDEDVEAVKGEAALDLPSATECRLALYTSGSSGAPKRIDKTLAQLDREVKNLHALWGEALAGASVLATVPHFHIYGLLFRLLWPLAAGRPAEDATSADPQELARLAQQRGAYVLVSTPAHLARFPELLAPADWPRPRIVFSSGAPLAAPTAALYRGAFGAAPVEVFGSTETGGVAWRQRDGSAQEDAWTPFPGIGVRLDRDGALLIDSPYLEARGWRMEDAATLLPQGRFLLGGRLDRVVKIEGKRLSLPELEQRLQAHAWVAAACAVPLPAPRRLGVVIVPSPAGAAALEREGRRAVREALRRHLAAALDPTLLPRRFRFVAELPVGERGKVALKALQELLK